MEAKTLLREFGRTGFELPLDATWLTGMIAYADAAIDCRDAESCGPMLEQLAPFSEQWHYSDISTAGPISRTLGGLASVLGRYDEAESFFAHAAASSQRADAKFFTARTELYWGLMLMARRGVGDSELARHLLSSALATAVQCGYGNVERRANAALSSLA